VRTLTPAFNVAKSAITNNRCCLMFARKCGERSRGGNDDLVKSVRVTLQF